MPKQLKGNFSENTYFSDPNHMEEMVRLNRQGEMMTKNMGGVLPEQQAMPSGLHRILDIACGPGEWALSLAAQQPTCQVIGIDISQSMVEYASVQAEADGLVNTHFRVMNALGDLDFPDDFFDVVNARLIASFMEKASWPQLLQECRRITRPGGLIRLTECEVPLSSSAAYEELNGMLVRALYEAKHGFSPRAWDITPHLGSLLRTAGYQDIHLKPYLFAYQYGTEDHASFYQDFLSFSLVLPFLLKWHTCGAQEDFEKLYQRALVEMQFPDFCALWPVLTAWAERSA